MERILNYSNFMLTKVADFATNLMTNILKYLDYLDILETKSENKVK